MKRTLLDIVCAVAILLLMIRCATSATGGIEYKAHVEEAHQSLGPDGPVYIFDTIEWEDAGGVTNLYHGRVVTAYEWLQFWRGKEEMCVTPESETEIILKRCSLRGYVHNRLEVVFRQPAHDFDRRWPNQHRSEIGRRWLGEVDRDSDRERKVREATE